ncbi:putative uncharacterized protein C5orf58 homolog isoform X2 [Phyllostomus hastatus]|uniref:putative uncharacterized protein C5orf58 homolog isoform X2 n=1 Tax=Phyllostomus hastatus TaxID=9423 RepID=UPI001E67FA65|nr:putative uncharacterized protein C5orf58 homolog isoform X2 [Phyllostomus hastatus]
MLPALIHLFSQRLGFFLASRECLRKKGATSWRTLEGLEERCSAHVSETRKCKSLTLASVHSGSEVQERNRISPCGSGKGGGKEIKMLTNDVAGHKLNVEAIIKNIDTISLELKKMKGHAFGLGSR